MPSPRRRPKPQRVDPSDLPSLTDADLNRGWREGQIDPAAYGRELHRRVVESNGGVDPYGHLRVAGGWS